MEWERCLRNELVKLRAQKKGIDVHSHFRGEESYRGLEDTAREAFQAESPLAAEEILARARWRFIEEIETGHHFDLDRLITYYLKLQLLERKNGMTPDTGKAKFEETYGGLNTFEETGVLTTET